MIEENIKQDIIYDLFLLSLEQNCSANDLVRIIENVDCSNKEKENLREILYPILKKAMKINLTNKLKLNEK